MTRTTTDNNDDNPDDNNDDNSDNNDDGTICDNDGDNKHNTLLPRKPWTTTIQEEHKAVAWTKHDNDNRMNNMTTNNLDSK